jgi:large repetitive protein
MNIFTKRKGLFLALFFLFLTYFKINATTFTVTNLSNSGAGSLREAIDLANNDLSATSLVPHIIDCSALSGTINLTGTTGLELRNHITINGTTNGLLTINRASASIFGIFLVFNNNFIAKATFNNLAIQNGLGSGGGVRVLNASVVINNCQIQFNNNSNNSAPGILSENSTLEVNNTTINNNTNLSGIGGGALISGGSAIFTNCTIANNIASVGAGIDKNNNASVTINSCTITGNNATDNGGGLYIDDTFVTINNSIIINNISTNPTGNDIFKNGNNEGVNSTFGHNLIGDLTGFLFTVTAETAGNVIPADPSVVLQPTLVNNGGATPTFALTACSPAIDAGATVGTPLLDQRGNSRVGNADIGAYEYNTLVVNNLTSCGPNSFTLSATGGTQAAPFYRWFNVPTGGTALATGATFNTGLISASTTFYVEENASCISPKRYPIEITIFAIPAVPVITPAHSTDICIGNSVQLTSSAISSNNYLWSVTNETTQSISASVAGSYTVTVTSADGCSNVSAPVVVTLNAPPAIPTITVIGTLSGLCANDTIILESSSTINNVWSTSANDTLQSITVLTSGTYFVTVSSAFNCSSSSTPISINFNPLPAKPDITANGPTTFCQGAFVELTSNVGGNLLWTPSNETTQGINAITSGNYFVELTDANGCKNYSDTIGVVVNIPVVPNVIVLDNNPTTFCQGDSIELQSTSAVSYLWSVNNETTQNTFAAVSGTYHVVTTDANNCTAQSNDIIVTVVPITTPVISPAGPITLCQGQQVVLSSDQVSGNNWSDGSTGTTLTVTTSGNYFLTIPGCSDTSNVVEVIVNPVPATPTISPAGPLNICQNQQITLTSSSATNNTWSPNNETSQQISVSSAGQFSVTVTNNFNCSASSQPVEVTLNPLPVSASIIAQGDTTFCQGENVVLVSSQVNNNLWSTGETTQSITVSTSQSVYLNIVDNNSCASPSSDTVVVTVLVPVLPIITPLGPTTICQGSVVGLVSSFADNIVWSTGDTNDTISVFVSSSVTVTHTDINGCLATSLPTEIIVNSTQIPTITSNGTTTICVGDTVQLTSSIASGNSWFLNGNPLNITTLTIFATQAGDYTVQILGCSAPSVPTTVIVNNPPTAPLVLVNGSLTFCQGGSVNLLTNQASNVIWNNGQTAQSIIVSAAGTYNVTFTDGNGCTATSSDVVVTVNPLPLSPVITPASPVNICLGQQDTLFSSYISNNQWLLNGSNINAATNSSLIVNTGGEYSVVHTDANGCSSVSATVQVNILPPITPTITASGPLTFCEGGSVTLTSSSTTGNVWSNGETSQSITLTQAGTYSVNLESCGLQSNPIIITINSLPTAPVITANGSTEFCFGDSVELASNSNGVVWSNSLTTQNIFVLANGNYSATITDVNGCSATSNSILVNVLNPPFVDLGNNIAQCGGLVTLNATNTNSDYLWSTGDTTATISVGTGSYFVIVSNICGVDTSNTISVTINPLPIVNIGGPYSQCGGSITLDAGNTGSTYLWSTGETTQTISASTTGTYIVSVTNSFNCTNNDTTIVNVDGQLPDVDLGNDIAQCGGTVLLEAGNSGAAFQWTLLGNATVLSTAQNFSVSNSGTYIAFVTNACGSNSDTIQVTINSIPTVNLGGPYIQCLGTVNLNAGLGFSSYTWSTSETSSSIVVDSTGTYSVTVVDANNCSNTASAQVTINTNIPVVNLGGPYTQCGGSVVLDAGNPGSTYNWLLGGGQSATTQTVTITETGNYTVIVNNGCGNTTASAQVNINALPVLELAGPYDVCDATVTLNAGNATSYVWTVPVGVIASTTAIQEASVTGNYSVTITGTNGCTNTDNTLVTINQSPITVNLGGPFEQCGGTVNLNAGNAGSQFLWSTGETTQSISISSTTGTETVSVSVTNSCGTTNASTQVTINPLPIISLGGPFETCDLPVTLNAGNLGSTFVWTVPVGVTASTNNTQVASISGNYSVLVTDANSCSNTASATVTISTFPVAPTLATPTPSCNTDVVLNAAVPNGNTILWLKDGIPAPGTNNASTYSASSNGNYSIIVSNICGADTSNEVAVVIFPLPSINLGGPYETCTSVLLNAGNTGSNFQWTTPLGAITTQTVNANQTGNYIVVVTDANNCSNTASANVTILTAPLAPSITNPAPQCGGSVTIDAGTVAGATYQWFNPTIINNAVLPTLSVSQSGTYFVVVTNQCGSATSNNVAVVINAQPTVDLGGPYNSCGAQTLDAGNAGATFTWTVPAGVTASTSSSQIATATGTYTVLVSNGICTATSTASVNVSSNAPINTLNSSYSSCGNLTLDAGNAGSTYAWTLPGGGAANTQTIIASQNGVYSVTITNACGTTTSGNINVTILQAPNNATIVASGNTTFCFGESVTLSVLNAGGTVSWVPNTLIPNGNSVIVDQTTVVQAIVTSADGCTIQSPLTQVTELEQIPTPVITPNGNTIFCNGNSVSLTVNSTLSNVWTPTGQTGNTISATVAGDYQVTVFNSIGCSATSAPLTVVVNPIPVALITATEGGTMCEGKTDTLKAFQTFGATYSWTPGNQTDATILATTGGNYFVTVTLNGCTAQSPTYSLNTVAIPQKPTFDISGSVCSGTGVILLASDFAKWYIKNANVGEGQQFTATVSGYYTAVVSNAAGCTNSSDSLFVNAAVVGQGISLKLEPKLYGEGKFNISENGKNDGEINLTTTGGQPAFAYSWTGGSINNPLTTEDVTGLKAGTYTILVTDANGCTAQDTITLKEPRPYKIPEVFTPNGDGKNDFLIVGGIENYPNNTFEVYNRWGSVVYSKENYKNEWDGKNNNNIDLPEGTYFIVVTFKDDARETIKGYIDIKR